MGVYEPGDLRFQAKNLIFRAKAFFRHHWVSEDIVRAKRMAAKGGNRTLAPEIIAPR